MNRRRFIQMCSAGAWALGAGWSAADAASVIANRTPVVGAGGRKRPYILGADVSWVPEDEAQGAVYYDRGVKKDIFEILKAYQFNFVRLRVFVNPHAPGGYSARRDQAFCDLEHTKVMAKRVQAAGMGFLLDFHYSDTWTSPGHQAKPAAWADFSMDKLTQAVHDWTKTVVAALKDAGTPPQMVQIGNETSDGMLFPDGRRSDFDHFAALTQAGCLATREVDPKIEIMLHHHLGRDNAAVRAWVDNFLKRKTDFDIIGMSCYAEANKGQDWKNNFNDLAVRYPHLKLAAAEYSPRKRALNDVIFNAPNEQGIGSFIWEPTRWMEAIFDKNGMNAGGQENNKPHLPANPMPGFAPPPAAPATQIAASQAGTQPVTQPGGRAGNGGQRRFGNGGRYDTNAYILEYREMAKAYGLVKA